MDRKPESFGKFQLLERIGAGGMAEIFLALPADTAFSKLVAVKRILPDYNEDAYYRRMFRREGQIAVRFRHPAIVAVHEMGQVDHQLYISMEYFPGKTLAELIRNFRDNGDGLQVQDKLMIIKQIADGLHYIHEFTDHGEATEIIHRDISPQNILVGFDGAVKLIDFGVARINTTEEATHSDDLKGKIAYMSPEQARGDTLTKQTDVFSLGIVLWELLACKKLFTGKSADEVSEKVEKAIVPDISLHAKYLPVEVLRICKRALAKDVRERYKTAADFSADLEDALKHFVRTGHAKRVAKALHGLFPKESNRLQIQLKKYEAVKNDDNEEDFSPQKRLPAKEAARAHAVQIAPSDSMPRAPLLESASIGPSASAVKKRSVKKRPSNPGPPSRALYAIMLLLFAFSGVILGAALSRVPQFELVSRWMSHSLTLLSLPELAKIPRASAPVAKSFEKVDRTVAAQPLPPPAAFVTILVEPNVRIWIDGELVGMGSVRDLKVPTDRELTIYAVLKTAGFEKRQTVHFKAGTRNLINWMNLKK